MGAELVRALREKLGLTQDELSESLGLAGKNVVSRWETGERFPGETSRRLFKYLLDLPKVEAEKLLRRFRQYGLEAKHTGELKKSRKF